MTRGAVIKLLVYAGYHDDADRWVRLYVENRVSYQAAREAWNTGARAKTAGVRCECFECKEKEGKAA